MVASLAEAWIEIDKKKLLFWACEVASLAEAWIEMKIRSDIAADSSSPPSRRRGLKSPYLRH